MSATDALQYLKRGQSVLCTTPDGISFKIESKQSRGLTWYRVAPSRHGCLNGYSLLSDSELLQWLSNVTIASEQTA